MTSPVATVYLRRGYEMLIQVASSLASPLLLVVRLCWGWRFFQTGMGKLGNLPKVTAYFQDELKIPFPGLNAFLAGSAECFGGLLLLVGLGSRLAALPLIVTMIVAYLTADLDAVKTVFTDPDKFLGADPFLFLFASILVFVFGPGKFSVDHILSRKFRSD